MYVKRILSGDDVNNNDNEEAYVSDDRNGQLEI